MVSFTRLPGFQWLVLDFIFPRFQLAALFPAISNCYVDTEPLLFDRNFGILLSPVSNWNGFRFNNIGFAVSYDCVVSFVREAAILNVPENESQGRDQFRLPVHSKPEEFENGDLTLKMHSIFSVNTTLEEFKNATITTHLGFVFEENHMIIALSSFSKSFAQMFFVHTKTESRRFQIFRFEERFREAPFSWRIRP